MKNKYIYMKVTNDEFELPIMIGETAEELSLLLGLRKNAVDRAMRFAKARNSKSSYKKIYIGD